MDVRPSRFASKFIRTFLAGAAALLFAACEVKITDRTPDTFSENPSGVYTITAEIRARGGSIREGSLQPSIVIDGNIYPMQRSPLGDNLWEYEYHLPPGRDHGAYYILAAYETESNGGVNQREAFTELQKFKVVNRYSLSLDANRAPVGAEVTVLGRGFTQQDTVYVGDQPAQTTYRSTNSLSFVVPPLAAGRNYPVTVGAPGTGLDVGTIRVDQGSLQVTPDSLNLRTGDRRPLIFSIPTEAPSGGLMLDITTDVPDSVIMPEVTIPQGARSVNVAVQGGQPGSGTIFISAPGFGEIKVPITVSAP